MTWSSSSDEPPADAADFPGLIVYRILVDIVWPVEPAFVQSRDYFLGDIEAELVRGRRHDAVVSPVEPIVRYAADPEVLRHVIRDFECHGVPLALARACNEQEERDGQHRDDGVPREVRGTHFRPEVALPSLSLNLEIEVSFRTHDIWLATEIPQNLTPGFIQGNKSQTFL